MILISDPHDLVSIASISQILCCYRLVISVSSFN